MKKGGGLRRGKPLRAKKQLDRGEAKLDRSTKLKPVNRKRRKRLSAEQFGPPEFGEFVRSRGCIIAIESGTSEDCEGPVEVAHRKSRGAGGKWRDNCYGLCQGHHIEQHAVGLITFENEYAIDGDLWACAITHQFDLAHPDYVETA